MITFTFALAEFPSLLAKMRAPMYRFLHSSGLDSASNVIIIIIIIGKSERTIGRKSLTDPQGSIVNESTYSFQQLFLILFQVILVYERSSIIQSNARQVAGNDFETVLPTCDTLNDSNLVITFIRKGSSVFIEQEKGEKKIYGCQVIAESAGIATLK